MASLPALRGGLLALLAAVLFGVSTPLRAALRGGRGRVHARPRCCTPARPLVGAVVAPAASSARRGCGAPICRACWRWPLFGAVIGPVALAWGLQRTSGASASLMLTLEAVFTAVLAWRLYRETMDRRVWAAMVLLLAGGIAAGARPGQRGGGVQLLGLLAVVVATAAWGVDNTLSRGLAERDPGQVVLAKGALGAAATALLALSASASRCRRRRRRWACSPSAPPATA